MSENEREPVSTRDPTRPDGPEKLPEDFKVAIHALGLGEWRERKVAAERLRKGAHERWPQGVPPALAEALLDAVMSPDDVDARAGANDVLVELGEPARAAVVARMQGEPRRLNILVDLLGRVGDDRDVDGLCELASTGRDENVRAAAVTALAQIGGEQATQTLLALLDDPSSMLQLYVLDALRMLAAPVPVSRLSPLLERSVSRKAAVELLGVSQSADAVPLLVPCLDDKMRSVRAAATRSLRRLHEDLQVQGTPTAVGRALGNLSEKLRLRVREQIAGRDETAAAAAVELAALCGDVEALHEVVPAMDAPKVFERAIEFVARMGARANPVLLELSEDSDPSHRENLFRLIGTLPPEALDPRLVDPVVAALDEPNEALALAACGTLERVGGRQAMAALYRSCSHEGELGERAGDALASIAARMGGAGQDDLMLIVGGSWPQAGPLARNLCRVVGRLGLIDFVPPLVTMLGSSDTGVRVAAALALGGVAGEHEGVGALCFALADEEPQVRGAAARSLGQLRAQRSVQALLSATADPSPLVRAAAVQALVAIGNEVTVGRMRELILDDDSPSVIVHAIAGIGTSTSEENLALLMSLCTAADTEIIKAAARALVGYPAHRATAALLGLLGHDRWDVRWAAAEVLETRGDPTALGPLRAAAAVEADDLVAKVLRRSIEALEGRAAESTR